MKRFKTFAEELDYYVGVDLSITIPSKEKPKETKDNPQCVHVVKGQDGCCHKCGNTWKQILKQQKR